MNPILGETPFKLPDGRELTIVLDRAALLDAAVAHTGKTKMNKLLMDIQPQLDDAGLVMFDEDGDPVKDIMPAMSCLLWAGLKLHHPQISRREVTNLIFDNLDAASSALGEAMKRAFPDAEGKESEGPTKSQTAKRSGSNGAKSA